MKFSRLPLSLAAVLVLFFSVTLGVAQEPPAPAPAPEKSAPEKAAADIPPATAAATSPAPVEAPEPAPSPSPLRRLDDSEAEIPAIRAQADAIRQRAEDTRRRAEESRQRARERAEEDRARTRQENSRRTHHQVVNIFADSHLPQGDRTDQVVSIFGSSRSEGEVVDSVVSIFGNSRVSGPVGDAVVAVFGNVTVDSHVRTVVAVFGNVELGPNAEVDQEVVCVVGNVQRDPAAIVHHQVQNIGRNLPGGEGLKAWLAECFLKVRPLAFGHALGWAWVVACSFLAFYVLLALIFRSGIEKCTQTLETRPGASALTAVCTVILSPIVIVLLCITGVGLVIVPFVGMGLTIANLFGKAVMLAWIGRRLTKFFGEGPLGHPAFAVLIGGLLVLFLYTVPVLGFLTYKFLGWMGLGVVVYTVLAARRAKRAYIPASAVVALPPQVSGPGDAPGVTPVVPLTAIPAITLPRAGFWIRLAALCLDGVLMSILCTFLSKSLPRGFGDHIEPPHVFLMLAVYGALMWKLRGTTIGGIVCGLKVVRLDSREVDWATAIVRALGCFLSLAIGGLGFIWVAIDDDKQSWHDKIAGTTVVRVPKGVSLL